MYQALYRKWRPRTFDDVVGQEPVVTTLKNEIRESRPAHAYLLIGSRGTGKTTCAKLIAKAVNCLSPDDGNPCGVCGICKGIDNGSVVDVVEIDAASNSGVDNIRDLREEANFRPNLARYRVYIIDEVHMLSMGAVNALLKIMEDPPEHVIFILATTEAHRIPATIQSRCQRFDFHRIGAEVIGEHLLKVAGEEGLSLTEDAAHLIGRLADGGMRDALSTLDLCASHSGEVTVETVSEVAGLVGQEYLFDLAGAIGEGEVGRVLEFIDSVGAAVEYDRICAQLVSHFRNLLVAGAVANPADLILGLPETVARYQKQAKGFSRERLLYAIHILQETQQAMTRTASRRAQLEIAAARLCDPGLDTSHQALLLRISDLEKRLAQGAAGAAAVAPPLRDKEPAAKDIPKTPAAPVQEALPAAEPAGGEKQPEAPPVPRGSKNEQPFEQWEEVLNVLSKANPALRGALAGTNAYLSGSRVLIDSDNAVFLEMMRTNEYTKESLKGAIAKVTGMRYSIGPYDRQKEPPAEEGPSPLEDVLQQALEAGVRVERE